MSWRTRSCWREEKLSRSLTADRSDAAWSADRSMESAPADDETGRGACMKGWRSEEDKEDGEAALQPRGPRPTGCAETRAEMNSRCERAEAMDGSKAPKADAGAAIPTASSEAEPAATRNGEGEPAVVSRADEGPSATSNSGLTTTVGERGPRDAPRLSPPDVQDAEAPVVEISRPCGRGRYLELRALSSDEVDLERTGSDMADLPSFTCLGEAIVRDRTGAAVRPMPPVTAC
mmetsp:Transcript_4286/g.9500  ORF Transcript_4286/g.9500 Transcript_4286/m.9500 type:complete len:233 (-) Transcript_4286:101-799(-)